MKIKTTYNLRLIARAVTHPPAIDAAFVVCRLSAEIMRRCWARVVVDVAVVVVGDVVVG